MTGSFLVPIVVPIVALISLTIMLGVVYWADFKSGGKDPPDSPPPPPKKPDVTPLPDAATRPQARIQPMSQSNDPVSPLVHLYTVLVGIQRDQVASQLEEAGTNDLKSIGVLGAVLAIIVALLLLKVTNSSSIGYWWWYPLPTFVVPAVLTAVPLRRSSAEREFKQGPRVREFYERYEGPPKPGQAPYTLEQLLRYLVNDFSKSWSNNDSLLKVEQRSFYWGGATLGIATLITLGLYAWGLS
jgi:hypothetical protein